MFKLSMFANYQVNFWGHFSNKFPNFPENYCTNSFFSVHLRTQDSLDPGERSCRRGENFAQFGIHVRAEGSHPRLYGHH